MYRHEGETFCEGWITLMVCFSIAGENNNLIEPEQHFSAPGIPSQNNLNTRYKFQTNNPRVLCTLLGKQTKPFKY